jgi:hypothetical protein
MLEGKAVRWTSVDGRCNTPDGGRAHWSECLRKVRAKRVETVYGGNPKSGIDVGRSQSDPMGELLRTIVGEDALTFTSLLSRYSTLAQIITLLTVGLCRCRKAISHSRFWLSAFGTPGPPLRGRGQIGPLGLLVGVFPIGVFLSHRIKDD